VGIFDTRSNNVRKLIVAQNANFGIRVNLVVKKDFVSKQGKIAINENINRLLREYFQKGFNLNERTESDLQDVVAKLNRRL